MAASPMKSEHPPHTALHWAMSFVREDLQDVKQDIRDLRGEIRHGSAAESPSPYGPQSDSNSFAHGAHYALRLDAHRIDRAATASDRAAFLCATSKEETWGRVRAASDSYWLY